MIRKCQIIVTILFVLIGFSGCLFDDDSNSDGDTENSTDSADFTWTSLPSMLVVDFQSKHDSYSYDDSMTFAWEFGDGETGEGHSISHEYSEPGKYTVSLTFSIDGEVQSGTSQDITVTGYGVVKWTFPFEDMEWGRESGSGSVALAADGAIYALVSPSTGVKAIYSISPDGTKNWKFDDFDYPQSGNCADPVYSNRSDTLYVVCDVTLIPQEFVGFVTAISKSGQKKWTAIVPDQLLTANNAIALRTSQDNLSDQLYLGVNPVVEGEILPAIYIVTGNGTISRSSYETDEGINGLAFGPSNNLYVLKGNGNLDVLGSGLATLWSYEQQTPTTQRGYMTIDADGRVFIPLYNPAGLQALQFRTDTADRLLWTYPTVGNPGPATINAAGDVCIVERYVGVKSFSPSDGSIVWEHEIHTDSGIVLGIAALEDGKLIAELQHYHSTFSAEGEDLHWSIPGSQIGTAAVADNGNYYVYGERDELSDYPGDALYAVYGSSPLSNTWTRHRGDNANTGNFSLASVVDSQN